MQRLIKLILAISLFAHQALAIAQTNTDNHLYYLAIKGGISLGSYESGINWVLLENIPPDNLVSFSGASAGSINSLVSAINACLQEDYGITSPNLFRESWNISIDELLGTGKNSDEEEAQDRQQRSHQGSEGSQETQILQARDDGSGSLFDRHGATEKIINAILKKIEDVKAKRTCNTLITMSVTKMFPHEEPIPDTSQTINSQRFVVAVKVHAKVGEKITFSNLSIENRGKYNSPNYYIALPENDKKISPSDIVTAVLASSAFPVAFSPVPMRYCFRHELEDNPCVESEARKSYFSDGGLFDNSPIGVSWEIAQTQHQGTERGGMPKRIVFIDPDNYRTHPKKLNHVSEPKSFGLADYVGYLLNAFDTATSANYKEALDHIENGGNHSTAKKVPTLTFSDRYHPLLADFHSHFGAFYSRHFRNFDFIVGVYDGLYLVTKMECKRQSPPPAKMSTCIRTRMGKKISSIQLSPKKHHYLSSDSKYEIDFIKFLYNVEFSRAYDILKPQDNQYIALYISFEENSKPKGNKVLFSDYIQNLKNNLDGKYAGVTSNGNLSDQLFQDYQTWMAMSLRKSLSNLQTMQTKAANCTSCDKNDENKSILKFMNATSGLSRSYITHVETGLWPLDTQVGIFSGTLRYGFDIHEKAQIFTLAGRLPLPNPMKWPLSFDTQVDYHRFGGELGRDSYWSVNSGVAWHFNNLAFPTVSLGYQHSFHGRKIYKDTLNSFVISVGMLNETISFKYAKRLHDIESFGGTESRSSSLVQLQFDVMQISKMVFNAFR